MSEFVCFSFMLSNTMGNLFVRSFVFLFLESTILDLQHTKTEETRSYCRNIIRQYKMVIMFSLEDIPSAPGSPDIQFIFRFIE